MNLFFSLFFITCSGFSNALEADEEFFESRIRPVLYDRCIGCHGASEQQGGLRLDSRDAILGGGDSGPALVPGKPEESLLLKAIRHDNAGLMMPPPEAGAKLSQATIDDFSTWIKNGVNWPKEDGSNDTAAKGSFDLEGRIERLPWIWRTPQQQEVPAFSDSTSLGDIDRFIIDKLHKNGLKFSAPADDMTWLRRVHFAITGLPPTQEQIRAFRSDASQDRRPHVVDGLLASPHFGERWARHWMDLMRYAETRGHESDFLIANAWQYRDYLIRAFNADVPYDRFVAEHIAGDLIDPRLNPGTGGNESVIATGWAFLGEEVHSPVDIRQDECERIDNKVDVLSKAFLGLTIACARCHDHKFDAITQRDYYGLSGVVLGSSFRQARFETMEPHRQAAERLSQLREKYTGATVRAFAEAVRPNLQKVAPNVIAASRILSGEKQDDVASEMNLDTKILEAWVQDLEKAKNDPIHPLRFFSELVSSTDRENATTIAAIRSKLAKPDDPAGGTFPPDTLILADFTKESTGNTWKSDGPGFGSRPLRPGELIFGTTDRPIARAMTYTAAVRDAFWKRLTLTPGTEMDSGRLGAAARSGKTLLTPTSKLASGQLHYLLRGKAQVYASVDSHIMLEGPLHGSLTANFDSGGQLRWLAHNLSEYSGHRLHLEFSPIGDSDLEVLMVVESPTPPTWLPIQPWTPHDTPAGIVGSAEAFRTDCATILDNWVSGKTAMEPRMIALVDWLVQNAPLLNVDWSPVTNAAAEFFREESELAKSIRWDSPTAVSLADVAGIDGHVLIRGKPTRLGPIATRGLPEAFARPRISTTDTSGRAELASQLIDPSNPLVARVMVNRVWHHLFGRGIVSTVDNFGYLGTRPSHPELLDHLAWQFVHEEKWSVKQLIRKIVLSQTFAQESRTADASASEIDPENLLLHRMPLKRLEGEAIRDAMLVISGRFDPKLYGPPVPVHLTEFIIGRGRPDVSGPLDGSGRRSIYIATRRNFLPTMMLAFDFPTPFSTVGRRNVTNVPAQTLTMMNDPFIREQAHVWAVRLVSELPEADDMVRLSWLFETAYCRQPTEEEVRLSKEALQELRTQNAGDSESVVWSEFCHALVNVNDFIYLK